MEATGQVAKVIVSCQGKPDLTIELADTLTIGRSSSNQLVIADQNSSRRHAEIRHFGKSYRVFDSGSANGTWLNGRRLTVPKDLEDGDRITIGGVTLLFIAATAASDSIYSTGSADGSFKTALDMSNELVVVLVCDIRNYTSMSESLSGEDFTQFISEWFRQASEVIERRGGTIDKFIGDAVMAYWVVRNRAEPAGIINEALRATSDLIDLASAFSRRLGVKFEGHEFRIGVALNMGQAVFGNIGTSEIQSFTIVGDSVNVTFRLESLTKEKGRSVIVSATIAENAGPQFAFESLGQVEVKGRREPVSILALELPSDTAG